MLIRSIWHCQTRELDLGDVHYRGTEELTISRRRLKLRDNACIPIGRALDAPMSETGRIVRATCPASDEFIPFEGYGLGPFPRRYTAH